MKWNIAPLYTHWRHGSVYNGGGGCNSISTKKHKGGQHIFCQYNSSIEEQLQKFHSLMRTGNRRYQSEIDRYLVACLEERFQHLVLPRGNAPHYDNLPDFSYYAISILDPSKDGILELQQIFLLLRQCTPLRRRCVNCYFEPYQNMLQIKHTMSLTC